MDEAYSRHVSDKKYLQNYTWKILIWRVLLEGMCVDGRIILKFWIWDSHSGGYEEYNFLGCNAV
jgi:hypothetical protein